MRINAADAQYPCDKCHFMRVLVSIVPHKSEMHRSRFAWLSISNSIRWSYIRPDKGAPRSLLDFREAPSLHLRRLRSDASWDDVQKAVYPLSTTEGPGFVVCGQYSKPYRFSRRQEILIVFANDAQRQEGMHAVRMRISPWNSIRRNMLDFALSSYRSLPSSSSSQTYTYAATATTTTAADSSLLLQVNCFDGLAESILKFAGDHDRHKESIKISSYFTALKHRIDFDADLSPTPSFVETVFLILKQHAPDWDKVRTHRSSSSSSRSSGSSNSSSNSCNSNNSDITVRCISLVSSLFQIFSIGVKLAHVFDQIKKYRPRMNKVYEAITELLRFILESMIHLVAPNGYRNAIFPVNTTSGAHNNIGHGEGDLHEIGVGNNPDILGNIDIDIPQLVEDIDFDLQEKCFDALASIEEQIMRTRYVQMWPTNIIEKIEENLLVVKRVYKEDVNKLDLCRSSNDLGLLLEENGKQKEAELIYKTRIQMYRQLYDGHSDHLDIAESMNSLGSVLKAQGKLSEARKFYQESLSMKKRVLGEDTDHIEIASSINNLGVVLGKQGKFREAESLYRESLEMKRRILGKGVDNLDLATAISNLGTVVGNQGSKEDAELLYRESLGMTRRVLGSEAIDFGIAVSINSLGTVVEEQGRLDEAELLYKESLEMFRTVLGEDTDHIDLAVALHNLGILMKKKQSWKQAELLFIESLNMKKRVLGDNVDAMGIAGMANDLAYIYEEQGRHREAGDMYREGLRLYVNFVVDKEVS